MSTTSTRSAYRATIQRMHALNHRIQREIKLSCSYNPEEQRKHQERARELTIEREILAASL